jgi:hypothetical protein
VHCFKVELYKGESAGHRMQFVKLFTSNTVSLGHTSQLCDVRL